MKFVDLITNAFSAVRSLITPSANVATPSRPEDARPFGQYAPGAITTTSVATTRQTLEAHEAGSFYDSARLAEYLLRDSDLQSALSQRVEGLLGLPFTLKEGPGRWGPPTKRTIEESWETSASKAALSDLVRWSVMLGFAVAQVIWDTDASGHKTPRLQSWHPANVCLDAQGWWALTTEGLVPIIPGFGWVLYTPYSCDRANFYGAIRAVAPWVLRSDYSARDASRWSEVHGQGTWLAKIPSGLSDKSDAAKFLDSVRNIGRAAVIPLPQGGTPERSFDLSLIEAKEQGWQGFEFLLNRAGRAIRLAILGQDMTSVSGPAGGSYAQSKVGDGVRQDVKASDAKSLADCLRTQLLRPWADYLHATSEAAPRACWDASEPEDLSATATSLATAGQAAETWIRLGVNVDLVAYATKFGMPLMAQPLITPEQQAASAKKQTTV